MITIEPIATVSNNRATVEDDFWGSVQSTILLNDSFSEEAVFEIETFSHLDILYYFHKVEEEKVIYGARHPRNLKELPLVGIFAQRGKNRPNRLGLTTVTLIRREGKRLIVEGLDCIDGTPVIDIKPVMKEFQPQEDIVQPEWSHDLMKDYWKA
ncbi:SAM-dependent methyltransferase [Alkalicoccobacillus porphyridii]|uniref:SAM-dependent methyltransferase n=1 Tax=Alkalicoccobacillus porphyridii TaxID=2597270 RepID=A0A553ZT25_9BACI|nr:SAM-dependent methyltransferase [Alkalicoccobacillus porphyridii]TSB44628.1 SAM-dependent methyltransferase [Alkalicoccobacillus porphyridii]